MFPPFAALRMGHPHFSCGACEDRRSFALLRVTLMLLGAEKINRGAGFVSAPVVVQAAARAFASRAMPVSFSSAAFSSLRIDSRMGTSPLWPMVSAQVRRVP